MDRFLLPWLAVAADAVAVAEAHVEVVVAVAAHESAAEVAVCHGHRHPSVVLPHSAPRSADPREDRGHRRHHVRPRELVPVRAQRVPVRARRVHRRASPEIAPRRVCHRAAARDRLILLVHRRCRTSVPTRERVPALASCLQHLDRAWVLLDPIGRERVQESVNCQRANAPVRVERESVSCLPVNALAVERESQLGHRFLVAARRCCPGSEIDRASMALAPVSCRPMLKVGEIICRTG